MPSILITTFGVWHSMTKTFDPLRDWMGRISCLLTGHHNGATGLLEIESIEEC